MSADPFVGFATFVETTLNDQKTWTMSDWLKLNKKNIAAGASSDIDIDVFRNYKKDFKQRGCKSFRMFLLNQGIKMTSLFKDEMWKTAKTNEQRVAFINRWIQRVSDASLRDMENKRNALEVAPPMETKIGIKAGLNGRTSQVEVSHTEGGKTSFSFKGEKNTGNENGKTDEPIDLFYQTFSPFFSAKNENKPKSSVENTIVQPPDLQDLVTQKGRVSDEVCKENCQDSKEYKKGGKKGRQHEKKKDTLHHIENYDAKSLISENTSTDKNAGSLFGLGSHKKKTPISNPTVVYHTIVPPQPTQLVQYTEQPSVNPTYVIPPSATHIYPNQISSPYSVVQSPSQYVTPQYVIPQQLSPQLVPSTHLVGHQTILQTPVVTQVAPQSQVVTHIMTQSPEPPRLTNPIPASPLNHPLPSNVPQKGTLEQAAIQKQSQVNPLPQKGENTQSVSPLVLKPAPKIQAHQTSPSKQSSFNPNQPDSAFTKPLQSAVSKPQQQVSKTHQVGSTHATHLPVSQPHNPISGQSSHVSTTKTVKAPSSDHAHSSHISTTKTVKAPSSDHGHSKPLHSSLPSSLTRAKSKGHTIKSKGISKNRKAKNEITESSIDSYISQMGDGIRAYDLPRNSLNSIENVLKSRASEDELDDVHSGYLQDVTEESHTGFDMYDESQLADALQIIEEGKGVNHLPKRERRCILDAIYRGTIDMHERMKKMNPIAYDWLMENKDSLQKEVDKDILDIMDAISDVIDPLNSKTLVVSHNDVSTIRSLWNSGMYDELNAILDGKTVNKETSTCFNFKKSGEEWQRKNTTSRARLTSNGRLRIFSSRPISDSVHHFSKWASETNTPSGAYLSPTDDYLLSHGIVDQVSGLSLTEKRDFVNTHKLSDKSHDFDQLKDMVEKRIDHLNQVKLNDGRTIKNFMQTVPILDYQARRGFIPIETIL